MKDKTYGQNSLLRQPSESSVKQQNNQSANSIGQTD